MSPSFFTAQKAVTMKAVLFSVLFLLLTTGFKSEVRQARPFSGAYQIYVTVLNPSPPFIKITASGAGNASHLGRSWYTSETVVDYSTLPVVLSGTVVLTAANGDELHTRFTGSPKPSGNGTETIVRQFIVEGGTGRFEGASGSFTGTTVGPAQTTPDDIPSEAFITMKGTLIY